jgi:LPXTG-site transpeptidase (sortase) family protein
LFRGLAGVNRADTITFETLQGTYQYRVESIAIVQPDDVSVLHSHDSAELTLVTCYPFNYIGPAPKRFVVTARMEPPVVSASTKRLSPRAGLSARGGASHTRHSGSIVAMKND